jgi:hypothetical protein
MRDLASNLTTTVGVFPAVLTASPTPTVFDRRGFRSLAFLIQTAAGGITFTGTNKLEQIVEHSDDNSTFTAVAAADLLTGQGANPTVAAGGIVESYVAAKAAASTNEYGYIGSKRYVRVTPTFGGTHATGTMVGVIGLLGDPLLAPAS